MQIFWLDYTTEEECTYIPYKKEIHGVKEGKFVYWHQYQLLMVAPIWVYHKDIAKKTLELDLCPTETKPEGAGAFWNSEIRDWETVGFRFETPKNLRESIAEALGIPDNVT